jgi:hypothetical protein
MPAIDRRLLQNFDWLLLLLGTTLVAMGIANLISATHGASSGTFSPEVRRQLISAALGALGLLSRCSSTIAVSSAGRCRSTSRPTCCSPPRWFWRR